MALPILKDGDKFEGQACIQPDHLTYCPRCGCVRDNRNWDRWQKIKVEGETWWICPLHHEDGDPERRIK